MHYKNGRIAQNGDKVVQVVKGQIPVAGILYDAIAGNDACNGRIAVTSSNDPYACLYNVLHADDVAVASAPDSTSPAANSEPGPQAVVAVLVALLLLCGLSAKAQTNLAGDFESGLLSATNYSVNPYATYAPRAPDKVGGGVLIVYNVNKYAGLAVGGDYLGQFTLISGDATLQLPVNLGNYISASWATNLTVTPFVLAGIGKPEGGSNGGSVSTIEDVGAYVKFGHLWGGYFDAGASYGQWQGAGAYSGVRYHGFVGWTHGF